MIITETKREITGTLTGETRRFTIAATAKAFRTLVDGLYSDKYGSVVRELCSNAYDAHIRNGNPTVPFEVRLPNGLNPTFSVRDFGCSMSHEEVMGLYSTLFESSKSSSNDETGAFGLGAKSFLALTDACTVVCYLDGEMRSYLVALDEGGIPAVTLVHRAPSDQPQGTEVTFAASSHEFRSFAKAMDTVALGYDVPPRILGAEIKTAMPVFVGKDWRLYTTGALSYVEGYHSFVRQGSAVYPWTATTPVNGHRMILDMPIGSVDVTASRESLSTTPQQRQDIIDGFRAAVAELQLQVAQQYVALTTALEKAWFAWNNRALMSQGYPTSVQLPFSLVQWKSESPYNSFSVQNIARVLIVHDDGTLIKRRQRRLKSLANMHDLYVHDNLGQIATVKKLLGLNPNQIVNIDAIPDIAIPARQPGTVTKKVIEHGRPWVIGLRQGREAGSFHWNNTRHSLMGMSTAESQMVYNEINKHKLGLLVLTPREAERALDKGTVKVEDRVDQIAKRIAESFRADTVANATREQVNNDLSYAPAVRSALVAKAKLPARVSLPVGAADLVARFFRDELDRARNVGTAIVQGFRDQYPLLFTPDESTISAYIASVDAA